jgi:hypothetical protein
MAFTYGSVTNCKVRNGQTRSEYELRLGYQVNSQDITTNTSNVTLRLECRSISSSYTTKSSNGLTSVIDGVTVKSNAAVDMSSTNTWQNFGERTITIYHNADGTYSTSKSGSFTCTAGSSNYSLSSGSASVTVAPATIPRASQPSLVTWPNTTQDVTIGNKIMIHMNRVSPNFVHYVYAKWGDKTVEIGTNVGDNIEWTIPLNFCDNIPNSNEGWGTVYVDTWSNGNHIGTKAVSFKGIVPSSVVPSISSISISAGNTTVPTSWGVYVQGKSQLKVTINASGAYGSTITTYKTTGIDSNTYWASSFVSALLQKTGTNTITVKIVDSRGREATKTVQYNCVAYNNPSISVATVTRCNADGTDNEEGEYVKYNFKASIAPVSNKNGSLYQLGYKTNNEDTYTYITIAQNTYSLDKKDTVISGVTFSADNSYDFHFYIGDTFVSTSSYQQLGTGFTLLDFNASGKGMAIGKVSEKDALEIGMTTYFDEFVYIGGGKVRASFSLYDNSSGSNGTITLSDSAANYNILEIFYRDNNGNDYNSTRVFGPNGKNVYLSCIEAASTPATNIRTSRYSISGTSMTVSAYTYTQIPNKNNPSVSANNYLYVTKVMGYI